MTVSVRELTMVDERPLAELLDTLRPHWTDGLAPGASGPRAFVADPRSLAFGGYVDDEPAGWLWGTNIRRPDGRLMSYVHELAVVAAHRRRGLGAMLLQAAIGAARRAGSHRLWLVTEVDNAAANALYRSAGGEADPARSPGGDQRRYHWDLA